MYGLQARSADPGSTAASTVDCAPRLLAAGRPPKVRTVFGRHTLVNANKTQNAVKAPVISGR